MSVGLKVRRAEGGMKDGTYFNTKILYETDRYLLCVLVKTNGNKQELYYWPGIYILLCIKQKIHM